MAFFLRRFALLITLALLTMSSPCPLSISAADSLSRESVSPYCSVSRRLLEADDNDDEEEGEEEEEDNDES